jgi:hypothetical protein
MLTEINRDRREVRIVFTTRFDEYNHRKLQRLSAAPQNVFMSAKIKALGKPGRTRATNNGRAKTSALLGSYAPSYCIPMRRV